MFITICGLHYNHGSEDLAIGQIVNLEKELDNHYDDEAILVYYRELAKIGYVANSVHTKARGTYSAGRIYDTFKKNIKAKILFIYDDIAIAEIIDEKKN